MALGEARLSSFNTYLLNAGIPVVGLSLASDAPAGLTIQYDPSATAEQQAWAEAAKAAYDWRARRPLTAATIANFIQGLTAAQQNTILRRFIALVIRMNLTEVQAFLAEQGGSLSLPYDEVDPTNPN